MNKFLELKINVGGGAESTPFPNSDNPIVIGAFRYDAKRMGGAPTITASVNYPSCLDDEWTDNVYAEFNGEKYYLKQTPTSSYDNADTMYKHDITLVSERVALDNVYFFDVVTGDPMDSDKPVSNSTKVVFFGDVREFARRMNASLEYAKLLKWEDGIDEEGNEIKIPRGYHIVVDDDIVTEEKLMSFEDQFFSNVLQEIYNTYEVPYYFVGKTIHIGDHNKLDEDEQLPVFAYGVDDALLSITKNNANYKIVNRATGTGSSDNIPFYYPNNSPKGDIAVDTTSTGATFTIVDGEAFSNEVGIGDVVVYGSGFARGMSLMVSDDGNRWTSYNGEALPITITNMKPTQKWFLYTFQVDTEGRVKIGGNVTIDGNDTRSLTEFVSFAEINNRHGEQRVSIEDGYIDCGRLDAGSHSLKIGYSFPYLGRVNYTIATTLGTDMASGWYNETQEKETSLAKMGLAYSGTLASGDTITQRLVKYVKTSQKLMPSIYRETDGKERFYNATNGTYEEVTFNNPFVEGHPKEHIITVEDIKPSIKETVNSMGLRMDMFSEFAYDLDDNDELVENEEGSEHEYVHSYFFAKLRKLDFNLFDHAIEQQPMTISFTSGDCGACNFEIGVTEEFPQKNPVQVNADGTLKRDEKGRVICGQFEEITEDECQPQQQDTINNEVWIALKKEDSTYGILMPKAPTKDEQGNEIGGHRPKACSAGKNDGDTFVILGINLPHEYIEHAEKKLEAEIIKYLKENNDEKFTFSISFSRIYFAENPDILPLLSENSKIKITYNNKEYDLYVSSFSYSMGDNDVLPEIRVELDDTLKVSQNALQNAISAVKSSLGSTINEVAQAVAMQKRSYVSKVEDDIAQGVVNFTKGIKFGEGGKVEVMDNNSAKLTIEYLEVTKKASFTSLEIQEKTHVGGQILVTPASINCGEVEELDDVYRCYFQTKGADGDEIFNQFAVGDQAVCQTYNAWGSVYYWRLVTGIGEDYIDLSKTDCDEDSGIPKAGDKIIQLGNRTDVERQNAIVIAAYGDGSPYIIQYKGINSFELPDDKIVTKLSSTENIFKGKVHMELGSDGLDTLPEWIDVKNTANEALEKVDAMGENTFAELEAYIKEVRDDLQAQIDGAIDSYFEDYEPSTSNFPAKDWATDDEKRAHLNDTFTNLSDGRSWRWSKSANTYAWVEIADTATSEALKIAGQAKASADGKIRMFVNQPTTPYSIGDLWSRGDDAPLMCCIKAKDTGNFEEDDWDLADNSQSYTDDAISNIKLGGTNLLRNSGFTGDYLSERLSDEKVLEGSVELYSSPLDHWDASSSVIVLDSKETISGKVANINGGTLSQSLYYNTVVGAEYVLSFKAKGRGNLTYAIGDVVGSVALTTDWQDFEVVVTTNAASNAFSLSDTNCTIGNLKLEKGNKATSWSASPLDNASDRAYYQSMKYIQNAFDGATDISGGLVLTEQIWVGDYDTDNKKWVKMNGGMSGVYESDHDVAFWSGGDFNQAIETVMQYADNPTFQPTEEQLASMAKFVVTHGGKAILNDIILRGVVYANGGTFGDLKIGKYVNACGQADTEDSVFTERAHSVGNMNYKTMVQMASGSIRAFGTHHDGQSCYFGNAFEVDADSDTNENRQGAVVRISATTVDAMHIEDGDIVQKNGHYRGFRPQMMVITDDTDLGTFDSGITIVADTTNTSIYLDLVGARYDGSNFEIHKVGNGTLVIGEDPTCIYYKGQLYSQYTIDDECCIKIIYSEQTRRWYMVIV